MLTRSIDKAKRVLPSTVNFIESLDVYKNLDSFDAVINLAGEPIINKRWTSKQKKRLFLSRWEITKTLVDLFANSQHPPKVFLSGSAIGVYSDGEKKVQTESALVEAKDFASKLCLDWEDIAVKAEPYTRVVLLRTGIVLSTEGGALTKMLLPFKLGMGGAVGDGEQFMSWIHQHDYTQALNFLLMNHRVAGAVNLVAPRPVTNKIFTKRLAAQLGRPALLPMPKIALKLILGESSSLLLGSQRVMPKKLVEYGFRFCFPTIKSAFNHMLTAKEHTAI